MNVLRLEPLPDELAHGYRGRVLMFNGLRHSAENLTLLAEWVQRQIEGADELSPVEVLAWLAGKSSEHFVRDHTTMPFRRSVATEQCELPHGSPLQRSLLVKRALCDTRRYACLCSQCVEEDVQFHGHSYWRRSHQMPGVYWCSKHGQPLHYARAPNPYSRFPSDWLRGSCEQFCADWVSGLMGSDCIQRYVAICNDMLMSASPVPLSRALVGLRVRAAAKGLRVPDNTFSPELDDYVRSKVDQVWLTSLLSKDEFMVEGAACLRLNHSVISIAVIYAALMDSADEAVNDILDCERRYPVKPREECVADKVDASVLREAYMAAKGNHVTVAAMLGLERRRVARALKPLGLPPIGTQDHGKVLAVIRQLIGGEVSLAQACQQHGLDLDYMRKRIDIGLAPLTGMLSELVSEPVEKVGRWPAGQRAPERVESLRKTIPVQFGRVGPSVTTLTT